MQGFLNFVFNVQQKRQKRIMQQVLKKGFNGRFNESLQIFLGFDNNLLRKKERKLKSKRGDSRFCFTKFKQFSLCTINANKSAV